jgi:3-methyladenine DNA glycosylase AlkD
MSTAASVLADLKSKGKENFRKIYLRQGLAADRVFGVSVAYLRTIAKNIGQNQDLALELYATGIMDAMYLAGMLADGALMTSEQLNQWAEAAANMQMVSEFTVPWVAVESPHGTHLAPIWIQSPLEHVASAGWCTVSGLVATVRDGALDLNELESLINTTVREIHTAPNRVRYNMNGFIIAVGIHIKPLHDQARAAAAEIGPVHVDMMGDTNSKVPKALDQIALAEFLGRIGQKRKSIRC